MPDREYEYDHLDVSMEEDVFRIAFDDPERMNPIGDDVHHELAYVFKDAYDSDARVVVLTGNGDVFSAGGDVEGMKVRLEGEGEPFHETIRDAEEVIEDLVNLDKPIVARVNGHATGLGATLALFCDIVVAVEDAKFGDPHVKVGLAAGDGGAVIWPLLTDMHTAKELLMTGDVVPMTDAEEMGLVNYAVPREELDEKVDELVHKLATGPQHAIRYTKLALNSWVQLGVNNVLRQSLALEYMSEKQPDHRAAVEAFIEGEEPVFPSGRDPDS
jgi:enoyl-CoA hydratase